jgi:hypothetical protein
VVEASHRASLVRVRTWSRRFMRGFGSLYYVGGALAWFSQGFIFFSH